MDSKIYLNNGKTTGAALGQFVNDYKGLTQIHHGGTDAGFRSCISRFPDQNFAVIILSNAFEFNAENIGKKITDLYLKEYFKSSNKTKSRGLKSYNVSGEELESFTGTFWNEQSKYTRKIYLKDGKLMYFRKRNNENSLLPIGKNLFQMEGVNFDTKISFEEKEGKKIMVFKTTNEEPVISVLCEQNQGLSEDWFSFEGEYYSEELQTVYTVKIKNNKLFACHFRMGDIALKRIKGNFFSGSLAFIGILEFTKGSDEIVNGFKVSNARVYDLWFKKKKINQ